MGRLLNPGLGELVDRYTILHLKIMRAPDQRETSHFHHEQARCQHHMLQFITALPEEVRARLEVHYQALDETNTRLWDMEDRMATLATNPPLHSDTAMRQVGRLGIDIWQANQERNRIIREINVIAGSDTGPEKL